MSVNLFLHCFVAVVGVFILFIRKCYASISYGKVLKATGVVSDSLPFAY